MSEMMDGFALMRTKVKGREVVCLNCDGYGLSQAKWAYEPMTVECPDCNGSGRLWKYPNGAIAKWLGGPLIGRYPAVSQ